MADIVRAATRLAATRACGWWPDGPASSLYRRRRYRVIAALDRESARAFHLVHRCCLCVPPLRSTVIALSYGLRTAPARTAPALSTLRVSSGAPHSACRRSGSGNPLRSVEAAWLPKLIVHGRSSPALLTAILSGLPRPLVPGGSSMSWRRPKPSRGVRNLARRSSPGNPPPPHPPPARSCCRNVDPRLENYDRGGSAARYHRFVSAYDPTTGRWSGRCSPLRARRRLGDSTRMNATPPQQFASPKGPTIPALHGHRGASPEASAAGAVIAGY